MSLVTRVNDLATRIATEIKAIKAQLSGLTTPTWNDIVGRPSVFPPDLSAFIGVAFPFAGNDAQISNGFLPCDGRNVSRTTYAALFAKIGILHGAGDGTTTFTLPDYRGRTLFGRDRGANRTNTYLTDAVGAVGGDQRPQSHTHTGSGRTGNDSPDHTHTGTTSWNGDHAHNYYSSNVNDGGGGSQYNNTATLSALDTTTTNGGHNHTMTTGGRSAYHQHDYSFTTSDASVTGGNTGNIPPAAVTNWVIYAGV